MLFTIDNSIMIVTIYLLPSQRYARRDVLLDMFLSKRLNRFFTLVCVPKYYFTIVLHEYFNFLFIYFYILITV